MDCFFIISLFMEWIIIFQHFFEAFIGLIFALNIGEIIIVKIRKNLDSCG